MANTTIFSIPAGEATVSDIDPLNSALEIEIDTDTTPETRWATPTSILSSETSEWKTVLETWTRVGTHAFTVSGDLTAKYRKHTYLRYKQGGSFEYQIILSSSYSAPLTTITCYTNTDYEMAPGSITDTAISYCQSPESFPLVFNYTPTLVNVTLGDGTLVGKFSVAGGRVLYEVGFIHGTTTSVTGSISVLLPSTPATLTGSIYRNIGVGMIRDVGTAFYNAVARYTSGASFELCAELASGTYSAATQSNATVPMTYVSGDEFSMSGSYRA